MTRASAAEIESTAITVLLIDESTKDINLIKQMLSGENIVVKVATDVDMGLSLMDAGIDLIILDLYLPYSQGYDTFEVISDYSTMIPMIVLTHNRDKELAQKAMHHGAQDYLFKETINSEVLVRSIRYAIERKKLVEEQRLIKYGLIESSSGIEQFGYVVAHDLTQPLKGVIERLQLLRSDHAIKQLDKAIWENISSALDSAARMQEIITDLVEFSKVGIEGKPLEPVNMEEVLAAVLKEREGSTYKANATVTHDPLPTILADRTQMTLLLNNLLDNTIRFRGTRPILVHISADEGSKEWSFSVKDNGTGIPVQFQDIARGEFKGLFIESATGEYPGAGIDLIISKRIVERHGGSLWVDSEGGKWSMYRYHIEDPVRFRESIKVTIEHGHANDQSNDYSSVAYWYQSEPHKPLPDLPEVKDRLPRKHTVGQR
jgi:signal transduction histidine kinase